MQINPGWDLFAMPRSRLTKSKRDSTGRTSFKKYATVRVGGVGMPHFCDKLFRKVAKHLGCGVLI